MINSERKTKKAGLWRAILWGGLIAGALDLTFALTFNTARGVPLIRTPQAIASGLLGRSSFDGGLATAALGVGLHFVIALGFAAFYSLASRIFSVLTRQAVVCGAIYGVTIFYFMRLVVLPLSRAPSFKPSMVSTLSDLASHIFFVGLTIALCARRYSTESVTPSA